MTESEIEIREGLDESHVDDALHMIYEAFAKKFYIGFSSSDIFLRMFRDSLNREYCFTAIRDGKLVGIMAYQTKDQEFFQVGLLRLFSRFNPIRASRILLNLLLLNSGAGSDEFIVDLVVVDPGTRGSGLGTRFLTMAEDKARELGKMRMKLSVVGENEGAIRLYERAGYRTYKTESGIWVKLAIKSDKALDMEKVLPSS